MPSLEDDLRAERRAVLESPMIVELTAGTLSLPRIRAWVSQEFHYMDAGTAWLGLMVHKSADREYRDFVLANLADEFRGDHRRLWMEFAAAWGLTEDDVRGAEPCPEVEALNDYLWQVCLRGHAVEALAALNVGLEGLSEELIARVWPALFQHYDGRDGVRFDRVSLAWLEAHRELDGGHSGRALALVERLADTDALRVDARQALRRAVSLFRFGLDGCYRRYGE